MATLADSFLDDLDELGESSDEEEQQEQHGEGAGAGAGGEGDDGMEVRDASGSGKRSKGVCTAFRRPLILSMKR